MLTLPVVLVVAVTAIHFYYPKSFMTVIAPTAPKAERAAGGCEGAAITVEGATALAQAHAAAAGFAARVSWVEIPQQTDGGRYRVVLATDWSYAWGMIWIDAACARVLEAQIPGAGRAGDAVERWIWPLHTGYAFGFASRLAVGLGGLVVVALYVSGLYVWWRKRQSRKRRRAAARAR